jgi:uncharacterized protein YndB with AHSA1/START domain
MSKITVTALVNAPVPTAWKSYTQPEHITNWNFASSDWQCPRATNDLRPGGKYSARMEAKDGSFGFDFEATYDEVKENRMLSYTMGDGRNATTTFEEEDGKTRVTTVFDPENMNPADMQQAGWQMILDNYRKYTESLA